jgi:hypothetical protein
VSYDQPPAGGNGYPPPSGPPGYPPPPGRQGFPPPDGQGYPQQSNPGYPQPGNQGYPPPDAQGYPQPGSQGNPPRDGQGYPQPGTQGYPPRDGQGYPQPGNQGYPQPGNQGYPSPGTQGFPPPAGQGYPQPGTQGYPPPGGGYPPSPGGYPSGDGYPPAEQQQRFSGLAIAGFILSFFGGVVGFVLSLIAIFKTGKGKKRGRGLAVSGVIISVVVVAGLGIARVAASSGSTGTDPGCAPGQAAILKLTANQTLDSVQSAIGDLNAAAAKAKDDNVRNALKTLADDSAQIAADSQKGKAPSPAALQKVNTDGLAVESLCSLGS